MSQSPRESSFSRYLSGVLRVAKRPATIAIGTTSATIILLSYAGLRIFLKSYLPPWLETQVSQVINRPVEIGELEGFSLTRLSLKNASIPPTKINRNQLTANQVIVNFNPLAVLLGQPLPIKISTQDVRADLRQNSQGNWLILEITDVAVPVDLDLRFDVKKVNVSLLPQHQKDSVKMILSGKARYQERGQKKWGYDINLGFLGPDEIRVQGETFIESTKSQVKLTLNRLSLSSIISLFPQLPVDVNSGQAIADINLNLPSLKTFTETVGQGSFEVGNFQGKIQPFKEPIEALINVSFRDNKVLIEQTQIKLGKILTTFQGYYDWNQGSNIDINIDNLTAENFNQVLARPLPFKLEGELQGSFELTGRFQDPLLRGSISSQQGITVAKTAFKTVLAELIIDLDNVLLQKLMIEPQVGGKIEAKGRLTQNLTTLIADKKPFKWQEIPLFFDFKTTLPSQRLINAYYSVPNEINLNNLEIQGSLKGTLNNLNGAINWQSSGNFNQPNTSILAQGNILIKKDTVLLNDTAIKTPEGEIRITGRGSLKTKKWQTYFNSDYLELSNFAKIVCQTQPFQCPKILQLEQGNLNLSGRIDQPFLESLNVNARGILSVDQGKIIVNSNTDAGKLGVAVTALEIPINLLLPQLSSSVILSNSQLNLSTDLNQVWQNSGVNLESIQGTGNLELNIGQSRIIASGKLEGELFEAVSNINNLSINQLLPNIPLPVNLITSNIKLDGNLRSLLFSQQKFNFEQLQMEANSQLAIADQILLANSRLNQGIIGVNIQENSSKNPPVTIKGFPEIRLKKLRANFIGNLAALLNFDLSNFQGSAQTELETAQGTITLLNNIQNNEIQANIKTQNIQLSNFKNKLFEAWDTDQLNGNIKASLPLNSLLSESPSVPINISQLSFKLGEQKLEADGSIFVSNLWQNIDIQDISLNVASSINLGKLPLTSFLDKIPIQRQFLPKTLLLTGISNFQGRFNGKNLLTAPFVPGNIELIGDLKLLDFSFNERQFEPTLVGKIDINSQENLLLNLQGRKDIIRANLTPCLSENCFFPYSLQSFDIRQNHNASSPIIAQGNNQDNRLIARVENFPLETLKIEPLGDYGIPTYVQGNINIDFDFNPTTSNLVGKLTVISPQFGKLIGDQLEVILNYQNQTLAIEKTQLNIGESRYNIAGKINLDSGEIQSKINIDNGYIQDFLTALQIDNWDSLLWLLRLKKSNLTTAETVQPNSIETAQNSIDEKLSHFWEISRRLVQQNLVKNQEDNLPKQLDFRGQFKTEINILGTLKNPQVSLQFQGNKWQWTPRPSTASIISPLGLVVESSQVIPIEKILIEGHLNNSLVKLNPKIFVGESSINSQLNFIYENSQLYLDSSQFQVQNLTLDLLRNLTVIPSDLNGIINLQGVLNGPLNQPEINGIFEFNEGVINARSLNQNIGGQFTYSSNNLRVATNQPDFIQAFVSLPFPIQEGKNDRFNLRAKIETPAFSLLSPLTLDQINWIDGEGSINLEIGGKLSINNQLKIALDPKSQIDLTLNNATLTNDFLPTPLILNGQINLQNKAIQTEKLAATLGERNLIVSGSLPLLPLQTNEQSLYQPLMVKLIQNKVNSSGIYQGLINGEIQVTGALISPILSGDINLSQGVLNIPPIDFSLKKQSPIFKQWLGTLAAEKNVVIPPKLNDLKIVLQEIDIERTNLGYEILSDPDIFLNLSGDLTLNGQINSLSLASLLNIKPSGQILVNRGQVNLPITRVFVSRRRKNTITFLPNQGLLNPSIDLELTLYLFSVGLQSIQDNEIADDIVQSGRAKSVEVALKIKGSANEVLPNIEQDLEQVCQLRSPNTPPISPSLIYSPQKLQQLANCIEINNLGMNSIADLLRSPIVSFSSNPPLSNSELLALFNNQLPDFAEQLQRQNSTQLVEAGVLQSAVVILPFLQDLVFETNEKTSDIGKSLGLSNLRLFPVLETVYELQETGLIRFSYDYGLNEATIRYETKF